MAPKHLSQSFYLLPPAFAKEKVKLGGRRGVEGAFFLHASTGDSCISTVSSPSLPGSSGGIKHARWAQRRRVRGKQQALVC